MKTYIIVYEDNLYGINSIQYEARDIFDALEQFMFELHGDNSIISITIVR